MIEAEEDTTPLVADTMSSTGHGMAPRTLGMSLFPVFMRSKSEKLFDACKKGNVDKVSLILKDSPKLASFKTNLLGVSALHAAAAFGEVEVVKELIRRGAKVNTIDSFSRSPLMYACRWGASPEIIQTLLEAKARPYRTDDKGRNCLHFLVKSRKSRKNRATSLALILSPSVNQFRDRTDINQVDKKGNTPLHQSCQNGNVRLSKILIQNGASVTIENAFCETALELGCQRGGVTCGLLRMLVEAGSDTDRIRDIDLSSIGAEEVPECLTQFHNLRNVDLSRNNLRSVPLFLLDIPSLRSVDLHENPLDDLPAHIRSNPRWKSIKRSISSPSSPEAPLL